MKPGRPHFPTSLVALLAAATLFALLFVNILTLEGIRSSRPWMARAREAQGALSAVRGALVDAETGQRGFLLTGDPRYLEPWHSAEMSLPARFADLRRLTADEVDETRRVAE